MFNYRIDQEDITTYVEGTKIIIVEHDMKKGHFLDNTKKKKNKWEKRENRNFREEQN